MNINSPEYKAWNKRNSDEAYAEEIDAAMDEYAVSHDQEIPRYPERDEIAHPKRDEITITKVRVYYDIEVEYSINGIEDFMLLEQGMDLAGEGGPASKAAGQFLRRWPQEKIIDLIAGHEEDEDDAIQQAIFADISMFTKSAENEGIKVEHIFPDQAAQRQYTEFEVRILKLTRQVEDAPAYSKQHFDAQTALLATLKEKAKK